MAKPPVSGHNTTYDHINCQTWILRVSIHCDGCKKKVFKVLQSIDGVYKTVIDSQQNKVTVTGSIDGDTLVQKLLRSGKHAEILPESFKATAVTDNASGNSKKKKKQGNKPKDGVTTADDDNEHVADEKKESGVATEDGNDGGIDQVQAQPTLAGDGDGNGGAGGGGKKKKKKKGKGNNNAPPNGDTEGVPTDNAPANTGSVPATTENVGASMEQLNINPPRNQMAYATPYHLPPYQNYYPIPAYGMSYSTSYPSTESSYYTPPVYGYAQSHPSAYYSLPPPPRSYPRSAFDDHDDEDGGSGCTIM